MIPFLLAGAGGLAALGGGLAAYSGATARKIEKAVPRDGKLIEVNGQTIHYTDDGSGPAIVMIHGLGGQLRNFARAMVDDLARDYRVIRVDRPGSGYSPRSDSTSARLRVQAETIAELIRILKLESPLIVGHSLGGALALSLALNHPDVVGGLALVAPLSQVKDIKDVPEVFKGLVIRRPAVRRAIAWTIATPMGMATADKSLREVFAPEPVPADFPTEGGGLLAMRPDNFYASSADLVDLEGELEGMVERYPTLSVPVSILYARADNLLEAQLHGERTAAEIPGAVIELVEGGHMLPFTQPELTAAFVRRAAARQEQPHARRAAG
ncbi:MAG TPA: alpha/beta hydrolase [Allosphingosinicella sp.]|jgi:pimeloyl-ACP methyl ester carboxylesterase|nr:alpha/beta hydrolase [Allosphingosinicella sp.]